MNRYLTGYTNMLAFLFYLYMMLGNDAFAQVQARPNLFPVKDARDAKEFFKDTKDSRYLKQFEISLRTEDINFAYIELGHDFLGIPRAPFRIGISGLISEEEQEEGESESKINLDRFLSKGGNAIVHMALPLYHNSIFTFYFSPKFGFDIPASGSYLENPSTNADIGVEPHFFARGEEEKINLMITGRAGIVTGSDRFYENIGYGENKTFVYTHITIALRIISVVRLEYSLLISSPSSLPERPNIISLSLVPEN